MISFTPCQKQEHPASGCQDQHASERSQPELQFVPVQDINLRELTKKYGRGIGLNIEAVRAYAAQMLMALAHLRNCGVLHADIKPDNILVSASRTMVS